MVLQGGWGLAEEETSIHVLRAVRSATVPLQEHIYAGTAAAPVATAAAAHCRVVARSALENVIHLEASQLASISGAVPPVSHCNEFAICLPASCELQCTHRFKQ